MYIKQVALLVILAQIGCYVPAQHATIPIRDRILSRLGSSDDMEHNLSTFSTEMKEVSDYSVLEKKRLNIAAIRSHILSTTLLRDRWW